MPPSTSSVFDIFLIVEIFDPSEDSSRGRRVFLESNLKVSFNISIGTHLSVTGYILKSLLNSDRGNIHISDLTYFSEMRSPLSKQKKCESI